MKEGDVVLAELPQADGKTKLRPVLLLRELPSSYNDFLVCGISSQRHRMVKDFDEIIKEKDVDYKKSGIIKESVIQLSFLAVTSGNLIAGFIGEISKQRHQKLVRRLNKYLINKYL